MYVGYIRGDYSFVDDRLQVLVVDCNFGIRLNGVKTKPIERTASQLSNDMKID